MQSPLYQFIQIDRGASRGQAAARSTSGSEQCQPRAGTAVAASPDAYAWTPPVRPPAVARRRPRCGQRLVQFVGETSDHLSHSRQPLALNDLLFQLPLHRDVAHRHDHAAGLSFIIKQRAGVSPHSPPASVAMPRAELAEAELLRSRADIVIESQKLLRLFLLGVIDFLSQQVRRSAPEQIRGCANSQNCNVPRDRSPESDRGSFPAGNAGTPPAGAGTFPFCAAR